MKRRLGGFWTVLLNRYYIDDFYMAAIVRPVRDRLSAFVYWTNQKVLDGIVNGARRSPRVGASGHVDRPHHHRRRGERPRSDHRGVRGLLKYLQSATCSGTRWRCSPACWC